jgi:hypothetical protein
MVDVMEGVLWKWTNYWSGKLHFLFLIAGEKRNGDI